MTQINLLDLGVAIPETADPDDIIKPNKVERLVLPGDVWKLGEHFVICGDATSPADLDRLLGGERPELLFTDPPYGMKGGNVLFAATECFKVIFARIAEQI